jgi:hypothetical protein
MEDNMEDVHADEAREVRRLLATVFEPVPADSAAAGDGLLRAVRRRHARRRRTRALVSAGAIAAAGAAAAVLLSVTVAGVPPALAAVTSALSRASAESFRMTLKVTQHNTAPGDSLMRSPLYITGKLDLKRNLGEETLSNGWRTLIVGGEAYTKLPPGQEKAYETGGRPWTEESLSDQSNAPPYGSAGGQLAWDLNSDRPFNPQALLALLNSGAQVRDEGPVSGPGWTGTRYRFSLSHPEGTGRLVNSITCTVDVDGQGHVRSMAQTTAFVAGGKPGARVGTIYTLDFTFSDFGLRFSVTPPPASQIDPDEGLGVQF